MPRRLPCLRLIALLVSAVTVAQAASDLPATVMGLKLSAAGTRAVEVSVRDRSGQLRAGVEPGIAVLRASRWSPNDPAADGASEFEVLVTFARLLRQHPLAGIVGVGSRNGIFQPAAEQALARVVAMGVPVVRLSPDQVVPADANNLFIEAGRLSEAEATALLSRCVLSLGALPPAADPIQPTEAEQSALREKIAQYQLRFDAEAIRSQVALR